MSAELTARLSRINPTTKIHRSTCGTIPVSFKEHNLAKELKCEAISKSGEKGTFTILMFSEGAGWFTQWIQPLKPNIFVKAFPFIIKKVRGDLGINPTPCSLCRSYELFRIRWSRRNNRKEWWLELVNR